MYYLANIKKYLYKVTETLAESKQELFRKDGRIVQFYLSHIFIVGASLERHQILRKKSILVLRPCKY